MQIRWEKGPVTSKILKLEIRHDQVFASIHIRLPLGSFAQEGEYLQVLQGETVIASGVCVSVGQKQDYLRIEVHSKPKDYAYQLNSLIQKHKYNDVFFQKQQTHKLLLNRITVDRRTLEFHLDKRSEINMPVYFNDSYTRTGASENISRFDIDLNMRWCYVAHGAGNLLAGAPDTINTSKPLLQEQQRIGNFTIIEVKPHVIQAAWAVPVNRSELVQINVNTDQGQGDRKYLRLFLNLNNLSEDEWLPSMSYSPGDVVVYMGQKHIMIREAEQRDEFDEDDWSPIRHSASVVASEYGDWLISEFLELVRDMIEYENYNFEAEFDMPIEHAVGLNRYDFIAGQGLIKNIKLDFTTGRGRIKTVMPIKQDLSIVSRASEEIQDPAEEPDVLFTDSSIQLASRPVRQENTITIKVDSRPMSKSEQ